MAIIDSVRKLAEKVGADTNGRTIADQLNLINQKLDSSQPGSRDIAEAASRFADKEDGTAILVTKTITENGTYNASDDNADGYSSVTVDVAGGGGETFDVELNVGWNTGQENVSFSSSKTLQEVISAHLSGKDVNFSVNFTYDGTLLTSNAATYLYIESGNMIVVLFSTLSGSTAITLPITWTTDSNSGIMYNKSQIIYVIPN